MEKEIDLHQIQILRDLLYKKNERNKQTRNCSTCIYIYILKTTEDYNTDSYNEIFLLF
jgi:hypothetical protein